MTNKPIYAAGTTVNSEKTISQINTLLTKYDATGFGYMRKGDRASIFFELEAWSIRMDLMLPNLSDSTLLAQGQIYARKTNQRIPKTKGAAFELLERQRWRELYLLLQAKLIAIYGNAHIRSIEHEFLGDVIITPSGETISQRMLPQLAEARRTGQTPDLFTPLLGDTSPE